MSHPLKSLAAVTAALALALGACGTDDSEDPIFPGGTPGTNRVPVANLEAGGVIAAPRVALADSLNDRFVEYVLVADDPDGNLATVTATVDGRPASSSAELVEIESDGAFVTLGAEPLGLSGGDRSSFAKTVRVRAPRDFEDSTTYRFIVTDTFGLADTASVTLVTAARPTALFNGGEPFRQVRFYNQRTPAGFFGAVDLDRGEAVASADDGRSELQDVRSPVRTEWLRQLQAESGAEIFVVPAERASEAAFEAVASLEDLLELYDAARPGNEPGGSITPALSAGDLIVVTKPLDGGGTRYYLVFFDSVNDGATDDNTDDYYEISVKRSGE